MQNLKIMKTTGKKKANASNNWSGSRFSPASDLAGGYWLHKCQTGVLRDACDDFNYRRRIRRAGHLNSTAVPDAPDSMP